MGADMAKAQAWTSGLVGTLTVAGLHEISRRMLADAPRLDVLGEKLIAKAFRKFGRSPPEQTRLLSHALGNVGADTVMFALIGVGETKRPILRGALIGLGAAVGAIVLPPLLGLGTRDTARTLKTVMTTVGVYVTAGLAAGAAHDFSKRLEEGMP